MKNPLLSFLALFAFLCLSLLNLSAKAFIPWEWRVGIAKGIGCKTKPCNTSTQVPDQVEAQKIALTFDDGPSSKYTPQVLDTLARHHVKATFFVLGKNIQGNEKLIKRMVEEGHLVAAHSWNHPNFWTLNESEIEQQIVETEKSLSRLGAQVDYFRFPNGNSNDYSINLLKSRGYKIVGWHVDTCDWGFNSQGVLSAQNNKICNGVSNSVSDALQYFTRKTTSRSGGIILLHDVLKVTAENLDQLLIELKKKKYEFVLINDRAVFPRLNGE